MSQSNNFDGPIILDEASTYVGFGRTGFNDFSDFSRLQYSAVNPNGVLSSRIGSLCMTPAGPFVNTDGAVAWSPLSSSLNNAEQYCFVWRPGGVAVDNVYTTWASLYTAASLVQGAKLIWLDPSLGTHTMTAGAYDLSQFKFIGASNITPLAPISDIVVTVNAGVTWTRPFYASHALYWLLETPATLITVGAGERYRMELRDRTRFVPGVAGGPSPIILTQGANARLDMYLDEASSIEQGGSGVTVAVGALGSTVIVLGDRASLEEETLGDQGGSGGTLLVEAVSPSAGIGYFQSSFAAPGNLTFVKESSEANVVWPQNLTSGAVTQIRGTSVIGIDTSFLAGSVQLLESTLWAGERLTIKKTDSTTNTVTILRAGADLIDGVTNIVLSQPYQSVQLHSTGVGFIYTVGDGLQNPANQYAFVWRPGVAVPFGNIFGTFSTLYSAASLIPGPKLVWVDNSLGAVSFDAGNYDLSQFEFQNYENHSGGVPNIVTVPAGVTFTAPPAVIRALGFTFTAAARMSLAAGQTFSMHLKDNSSLVATVANAITVTGGAGNAELDVYLQNSSLGGGAIPVIQSVDATGVAVIVVEEASGINADAFSNNGGAGVVSVQIQSPTGACSMTQTAYTGTFIPGFSSKKFRTAFAQVPQGGPAAITQQSDRDMYLLNTLGGDITLALLPAAEWALRSIFVKMVDATTPPSATAIVITPAGVETIDLAPTLTLNTVFASVELYSDGALIWIIG